MKVLKNCSNEIYSNEICINRRSPVIDNSGFRGKFHNGDHKIKAWLGQVTMIWQWCGSEVVLSMMSVPWSFTCSTGFSRTLIFLFTSLFLRKDMVYLFTLKWRQSFFKEKPTKLDRCFISCVPLSHACPAQNVNENIKELEKPGFQ